ncbi:MAG: hypothetical protein RI513_03675 [Balneolaceae bacterium]|nr:hypothetical protein [Balneolaceae bacterium]MDR9446372.1 hypothetical protein [Balneolaceae bacterium]
MVCKGNGVNDSLSPVEGGSADVDVSDSVFAPNNFGTGPIAVVLLGVGVAAGVGGGAGVGVDAGDFCGSAAGSAVGLGGGRTSAFGSGVGGGSAGGAEFNLFFLPQ